MHIIGHCHLRGGTDLEPELGGALYTAIALAFAEKENIPNYSISGVYGYKIPELEGVGLFTVQNDDFRIFFLYEGLYGLGIPYLVGKEIAKKINQFFYHLETTVSQDTCISTHRTESGSYWFDLICLSGLGENIPIEEIKSLLPLQTVSIEVQHPTPKEVNIIRMESSCQLDLGFGWIEKNNSIVKRIDNIFSNPKYSFLLYKAIYDQFNEFNPGFKPNLLILTYQQGDLQVIQDAIISIVSLKSNELQIRYCLPVTAEEHFEESQSITSYLRSLVFNSIENKPDRYEKNINTLEITRKEGRRKLNIPNRDEIQNSLFN